MRMTVRARPSHTAKTTDRGLGWEWQRFRLRILKRDCYMCQPCLSKGRATPATEVDHIVPRSKGGPMVDSNAQSICTDCHKAKTAEDEGHARRVQFDASGRVLW